MNAVGFTSQVTAGFRAVELQHVADPILCDPLAPFLAGEAGLQTALQDWRDLERSQQGPGKHLRVPARNRIVDDALCEALQQLAAHEPRQQPQGVQLQIVNLGCGMDSKPWRLQLPPSCSHLRLRWFDVDQPGVMELKQQLLQQAGAALTQQELKQHQAPAAANSSSSSSSSVRFPLLVDSWTPVAADLAHVSLADALGAAGFDPACCTVWLAEALIYYLPLQNALELLSAMARLSPPAGPSSSSSSSGPSRLVATCIDQEL